LDLYLKENNYFYTLLPKICQQKIFVFSLAGRERKLRRGEVKPTFASCLPAGRLWKLRRAKPAFAPCLPAGRLRELRRAKQKTPSVKRRFKNLQADIASFARAEWKS